MQSVKRYLKRKKLTQREFAEKVGVTPAQMSRCLTGNRGASNGLLIRISNVTRIPFGKLVKESKPDGRAQP
jgi:transcriptional regulator with XRE-family HTH domain